MTTLVTLSVQDHETGKSKQVELADDFDTVFDRIAPLTMPSSNLEHRTKMLHTLTDGRRIAIQPMLIAVIEEGEQ